MLQGASGLAAAANAPSAVFECIAPPMREDMAATKAAVKFGSMVMDAAASDGG